MCPWMRSKPTCHVFIFINTRTYELYILSTCIHMYIHMYVQRNVYKCNKSSLCFRLQFNNLRSSAFLHTCTSATYLLPTLVPRPMLSVCVVQRSNRQTCVRRLTNIFPLAPHTNACVSLKMHTYIHMYRSTCVRLVKCTTIYAFTQINCNRDHEHSVGHCFKQPALQQSCSGVQQTQRRRLACNTRQYRVQSSGNLEAAATHFNHGHCRLLDFLLMPVSTRTYVCMYVVI